MCYTGKCKYEQSMGDCSFSNSKDIPDDAGCALADKQVCNNCFFRSLDSCSHPEETTSIYRLYSLPYTAGEHKSCYRWRAREEWQLPIVDYRNFKQKCSKCKKEFAISELQIGAKGSSWTCKECV